MYVGLDRHMMKKLESSKPSSSQLEEDWVSVGL